MPECQQAINQLTVTNGGKVRRAINGAYSFGRLGWSVNRSTALRHKRRGAVAFFAFTATYQQQDERKTRYPRKHGVRTLHQDALPRP